MKTGGVVGDTITPIELDPTALSGLDFSNFTQRIFEKLRALTQERLSYYEGLRKKNAKWVNHSRWLLALLGSIAFLLTAVAAALRFIPVDRAKDWGLADFDKGVLLLVLAIYAVMGAMSFYERGTDKAPAYFRHLSVILAIRDLWTKLEFEFVKELTPKNATDPDAARERVRTLAAAFCNDLDKLAASELTEWRTEFLASLAALEAAAKKGSEDAMGQIQELVKAAEKAAADAKVAAKAAEEAARLGAVNLTVSGDFDGQMVVSVDGVEAARSRTKALAIMRVQPGLRKFTVHAKKGDKDLAAEVAADIKSGLQELKMALG